MTNRDYNVTVEYGSTPSGPIGPPSGVVIGKQDESYTRGDFAADLEKATRRVKSSRRGSGSPKTSA